MSQLNKTLVNTIQVKNLTGQVITVFITPLANSPIFNPAGGHVRIQGNATLEAEDSRYDKAQLEQMRRLRQIDTTNLTRSINLLVIGGSGTIPANA
jgi:hypothetical protein